MKVVCVIQARMGSSRLPGKSLKPVAGRPLIAHVVERARAVEGVDVVVLATSASPQDLALGAVARSLGVEHVAASDAPEWDVLTRVILVGGIFGADAVLRITGDCPLLAPEVATEAVKLYRAHKAGVFPVDVAHVGNDTSTSGYPDGTDVEVVSMDALLAADKRLGHHVADRVDREHVTSWVLRTLPTATMKCDDDWSSLKLSVDTEADLARVASVFAHLEGGRLSLGDTLEAAGKAGLL